MLLYSVSALFDDGYKILDITIFAGVGCHILNIKNNIEKKTNIRVHCSICIFCQI